MRSLLLILTFSLLFVGCITDSDSGNSTDPVSIIGIWQDPNTTTTHMAFRSDGTYYGYWDGGTYTTSGNKLTLQTIPPYEIRTYELEYMLNGNFLSIVDKSGSRPIYVDFTRLTK